MKGFIIIANIIDRSCYSILLGLFCFFTLVSCQKEPIVVTAAVDPEPDPPPEVIETPTQTAQTLAYANSLYEQGLIDLEAGSPIKAGQNFDDALIALLECQIEFETTVDFELEIEDLITRIHMAELAYAPEMPSDGPTFTNAVLDDLLVALPEDDEPERNPEFRFPSGVPDISFDLPVTYNDAVESFIEAFATRRAHIIGAALERSTRYLPMMRRIFKEEQVPLDLCYLPLIESAYRTRAKSRASAMGLWQFMRGTGRMYDLDVDWWRDERLDSEMATRAAARHLRDLHERFGDWYLALSAYNAGAGRVSRAIRRGRTRDFWEMRRRRLLPRETRSYVPAFLAGLYIAKQPEAYGFSNLNYLEPLDPDFVEVDFAVDLETLAEKMSIPLETLVVYNPSLIRDITPHDQVTAIAVPKGSAEQVRQILADLPPEERLRWVAYRLQRGDTLGKLARRYNTSVRALQDANRIRNPRRLRIGQEIMIPVGNQGGRSLAKAERGATLPSKRIQYKIQRGDTLYHLAKRYQTTIPSIMALNPNLSPVSLQLGETIDISQGDRYSGRSMNTAVQTKKRTTYVVQKGDIPAAIARRFQLSVRQLMSHNGLSDSAIIYPGQKLSIPSNAGSTDVIVHVVRRGDNLSKIAGRYGTSVRSLLTWNQLSANNILRVGQRILIYR